MVCTGPGGGGAGPLSRRATPGPGSVLPLLPPGMTSVGFLLLPEPLLPSRPVSSHLWLRSSVYDPQIVLS